jgi:hypothetical protein
MPTPESSEGAGEERTLLGGAVVVRAAALFCEVLRDCIVDRTDVVGVRVIPSQVGRVTLTFMECSSSDGAAGRRPDGVTVRRLAGLAADESAETRREPNLAFAEDSLEYPEGAIGP